MAVLCVPKYARLGEGFSRKEKAAANEHPGRRVDGTQSPAHWITCLADLKKTILLCSFCRARFNPRKHHYRRYYSPDASGKTDGYAVNGLCDACKESTVNFPGGGTMFIHEETYDLVCLDPVEARRRTRRKWQRAKDLVWGS